MNRFGRVLLGALSIAALGAGCGESGHHASPPARARVDVSTPVGLMRWMAAHPADAGVAVVPDRGQPLAFGATRRFPLASVRKVLIAGAAVQAHALSGTISRADVDRFFVPGADGGSHARAHLTAARLPLTQVAQAMIAVSDDAAADALLDRVGASRVDAWARAAGMRAQDPIYPLLGEFAAWGQDTRWAARSPASRAQTAAALARRVAPSAVRLPGVAAQRRLAEASVAGTPAQWARLMAAIGRHGQPELRRLLGWPLRQSPQLRRRLSTWLEKGGSLPGVITEAGYVRPRKGPGAGVAIFLRDLPSDVEAQLTRSFAQQKLALALAISPAFRARAARALR